MSYRHVSVTQSRPESRLFPALSVSNSPLKCWDDTWHITISRPGPDYPHRPWATLALHLYQGPSTFENNNHHTRNNHVRFEKSELCHNKQFIDRVTLFRTKSFTFISKLKKFQPTCAILVRRHIFLSLTNDSSHLCHSGSGHRHTYPYPSILFKHQKIWGYFIMEPDIFICRISSISMFYVESSGFKCNQPFIWVMSGPLLSSPHVWLGVSNSRCYLWHLITLLISEVWTLVGGNPCNPISADPSHLCSSQT